ncbi:MAG: tRNA1(Val) (adenine(37)-N6)-methyltransferase [Chitinophagaceae bacterium]
MSNNFFKFKQFTIYQDKSAMKVCTDACVFGATLPLMSNIYALDIGAGTGLLSLMFAQKNNTSFVDSIEIEKNAFEQAKQNIDESILGERINIVNADIKTFESKNKYQIIFCNPPFYANDLKSVDKQRNIAMHSALLSYDDLLKAVEDLIDNTGIFGVLLPFGAEKVFIDKANLYGLYVKEITRLNQTENHPFFRSIIYFTHKSGNIIEKEIIIKIKQEYSSEFKFLLKDYYLNL